ncbi:MAG: OmpA family protein [Bacteroidetes bacterium]|nr:OmpA family protein [Bacteroidota bacterium]
MKQRLYLITLIVALLVVIFTVQSFGQFQSRGVRIGGGAGFLMGHTEKDNDDISEAVQGFIRHNIVDHLDGDLSGVYGGIKATNYQADLYYAEYKLLYKPWASKSVEPYIGAGLGYGYYETNKWFLSPIHPKDEYFPYIPITIGLEWQFAEGFFFDLNGNYAYTTTDRMVHDRITGAEGGNSWPDNWLSIFGRLSFTLFGGDSDGDKDGLLKSEEKKIGTNPDNFDTDGDGLGDGDEVRKYMTSPLKADSDNDGLSDADEVMKYKTDPLKMDTDGDGLSDGDEVNKYKTDPLKVDTDGDGLSDGDEVTKYKTDPLKADTDGDGLTDGNEVLKYKTDPLKVDTDGDGLSDGDEVNLTKTDPLKPDTDGDGYTDGEEVKNKTNPLDPNDPKKPKPVAFKTEVGKAIVLEGIVFKTGSAVITDVSDAILSNAKKTLEDNPEIFVQIQGFTDAVGSEKTNLRLSQKRADAVKAWLIRNGISSKRITAKGFGEANPIGDNSTPEGRQKNRRIEFFRTK